MTKDDVFVQEQTEVINQSEALQEAIRNTTTAMEDLDKVVNLLTNPEMGNCSLVAVAFYFGQFYTDNKAKLESVLQYLEAQTNVPEK